MIKLGNGFPPKIVYPKAFDTNQTLFLVFNTSETVTTKNNAAWSDEIEIAAVGANSNEIWPLNGYANIGGELFYYDAVEKDINGKITKFKRCLRNLDGTKTKYNPAGTEVRGYVVASHHNQVVDAILSLESFVGENFSEDKATLDWRIRNLQATPSIYDDFNCPDVVLSVIEVETSPATGTLITYDVQITGNYNEYILEFGDGQSTTDLAGEHRYAPSTSIDPIVTISNDNCTIVQSPIARDEPTEPTEALAEEFEIKIPSIPDIPPIVCPEVNIPENKYNIPPIVFPCLDLGSLGNIGNIPSVISFVPEINIPDTIFFAGGIGDIPSLISVIADIPSVITVIDTVPDTIELVGCDIPDTIEFGTVTFPDININVSGYLPTIISVMNYAKIPTYISIIFNKTIPSIISFANPPSISVYWGKAPTLSCIVTIQCPSSVGMAGLNSSKLGLFNEDLDRDFTFEDELDSSINVMYENAGIPSEIKLIAPNIPDVKLIHDLPSTIRLEVPEIPKEIFLRSELPKEISLVLADNFPKTIELTADNVPRSILLDASEIPPYIQIGVPVDFPKEIKLDASDIPKEIKVVGIPNYIELIGPSEIKLVVPEVEMVYKGASIPVDVKIELDVSKLVNSDGKNCVQIVPCNPT